MNLRLLLLAILFTPFTHAQEYQNIEIGSASVMRRGLCEPSISINKKDPSKILAAAILDQVFYSTDSGRTWINDTLKSTYGVWGDPVLVSDKDGSFYFLHLSDPTGKNWSSEEILDRIVCQRSDDGGKTWNNGGYMGFHHPKDQDKQWCISDLNNGNLYATWTQFDKYGSKDEKYESNILFSMSTDKGETWSESVDISQVPGDCLDGDSTTEGAVPAVSPEGYIYVAWSNKNKIYFDVSMDEGKTWMENDIVIAEHHGGWEIDIPGLMRCNGMPVTVCDVSKGENRGTIYVNWVDDRNGNYDVWLSKSTDKGKTWSKPSKINDDETDKDQFLSWICCDPITGELHCVFYDRRAYDDNQTDVYVASSKDGGETWDNKKISESPFTPVKQVFFGDYNNIDAYDGLVRPIWTRYEKAKMGIWTAIMEN
jgi:Neuraminidase (sialidase)